jgi:hypothetical protein
VLYSDSNRAKNPSCSCQQKKKTSSTKSKPRREATINISVLPTSSKLSTLSWKGSTEETTILIEDDAESASENTNQFNILK